MDRKKILKLHADVTELRKLLENQGVMSPDDADENDSSLRELLKQTDDADDNDSSLRKLLKQTDDPDKAAPGPHNHPSEWSPTQIAQHATEYTDSLNKKMQDIDYEMKLVRNSYATGIKSLENKANSLMVKSQEQLKQLASQRKTIEGELKTFQDMITPAATPAAEQEAEPEVTPAAEQGAEPAVEPQQ